MSLNQATEPTNSTKVSEVINTEYIQRRLETAAVDPLVGELIANHVMLDPSEVNSYVYQLATANEFTGAAAISDNDAAPEESFDPTSSTITGSRIGLRAFVLDKPSAVAVMRLANQVIMGLEHANRDKLHNDILALLTSFSNSQGNNAQTHDLANHDSVATAFLGQNHDAGDHWIMANNDALRDLRTDLSTNAAALFGAAYGDRAANALKQTGPTLGTMFDNFRVHISQNTPAGDTTGWTNAMGVGSGVGDRPAALKVITWQDLLFAFQRDESRFGEWLIASMIYGVGIAKQANARAFITKT